MSLSGHRLVEATIGLALIVLSVVLNFRLGAFAAAVALGAAAATLGFAATREGRSLGGTAHRTADLALTALMVIAAFGFAVAGWAEPALVLGAAAVAQAVLVISTRYVERGAKTGAGLS